MTFFSQACNDVFTSEGRKGILQRENNKTVVCYLDSSPQTCNDEVMSKIILIYSTSRSIGHSYQRSGFLLKVH